VLLGSGDLLSAEQARQQAKKLLAKVALGEDPQADKTERRQKDSYTLGALVDEYLAFKQPTIRPPSTPTSSSICAAPTSSRCTACRSTP
jgi:hypothetical protein